MGGGSTSYDQFGVRFLHEAVTAERVRAVITGVAGERIDIGPLPAGPGGVASAVGVGRVEDVIVVKHLDHEPMRFTAKIVIAVEFSVDVAGASHAYTCQVVVRLGLTVRTGEPLLILIEVDHVQESDISVVVAACGLRAKMLQTVGGLEREARRAVRNVVRDLLRSPRAAGLQVIDLQPLIDVAWPAP